MADRQDETEAVRQYGAEHPEAWVGLQIDGDRIVATFTDPDAHREAVLARVADPGSIDVVAGRFTERHLESVREQVQSLLEVNRGSWSRSGISGDVVDVALNGGYDDLARQLHERFGPAVRLSVGLHRFPLDPAAPPPAARPAPVPTTEVSALRFEAVPDAQAVPSRGAVKGHVLVTNVSDESVRLETDQPLSGVLLGADGAVAGEESGFIAGTGRHVELEPGASTEIGFWAGTDAVDPRLGTTLPAGHYQLVVIVPVGRGARVVTPPVPFEITDPN